MRYALGTSVGRLIRLPFFFPNTPDSLFELIHKTLADKTLSYFSYTFVHPVLMDSESFQREQQNRSSYSSQNPHKPAWFLQGCMKELCGSLGEGGVVPSEV